MPSFPANLSAPSPRIAALLLTQDVVSYSQLHTAPKISADGAGTGQNGPVWHPKRHRKVRCDGAAKKKIEVPGLYDDVLKYLEHELHHNELASHSLPSILGFSQGSVSTIHKF
jgi:hypothetical protein